MENMNYRKEFKLMLDAWGEDSQLDVCIEEMAELTQALCKYRRKKRISSINSTLENIKEEIADVLLCVSQMAIMFGEEEVDKIMKEKIARAIKKLD